MSLNFENLPLSWVNRLAFLSRKKLMQRFAAHGSEISHEEWVYLLILSTNGEQTPGALAEFTTRDRTTITRVIDGMSKKGLVIRQTDPNDRRRSLVRLTARGTAMDHSLAPLSAALSERAARGIAAADIETTIRTLRSMIRNLNEMPAHSSQERPNQ